MRVYIISILLNKLFIFGCLFKKLLIHYFKVFRCITIQILITAKITKKTIINIYKIKVFEINTFHNF